MAGGFRLGWNAMLRTLWRAFAEAVRRYFIAGLLAFAPLVITIWAISWIVTRLDIYMNHGFGATIFTLDHDHRHADGRGHGAGGGARTL